MFSSHFVLTGECSKMAKPVGARTSRQGQKQLLAVLSEVLACMHHLQGKLPPPHSQQVLAIPFDFVKCSFTLPISMCLPIPPVFLVLKCHSS